MKRIIIGREGNQPFVISHNGEGEYVSRQNAEFTYDEATGIMTLNDLTKDPQKGTYIKGNDGQWVRIIAPTRVYPTTDVRLGPYYTFRIGQLFSPGQNNKKVDISHLRQIAENYETTKLKLDQKSQSINNLRMTSMICSVAGGAISTALTSSGDNKLFVLIGPIIAITVMVSLLIYCGKASKKVVTDRAKNEKEYKLKFCCPVDHYFFGGQIYENILAAGKCPKCKTEFYDSEIQKQSYKL